MLELSVIFVWLHGVLPPSWVCFVSDIMCQHSVIVHFHWVWFNTGSHTTIRPLRGKVALQLLVKGGGGDPVSVCSGWCVEITEERTNNPGGGGCLQSHDLSLEQVGPSSASQWGIWSQLSIQRQRHNVRLRGRRSQIWKYVWETN